MSSSASTTRGDDNATPQSRRSVSPELFRYLRLYKVRSRLWGQWLQVWHELHDTAQRALVWGTAPVALAPQIASELKEILMSALRLAGDTL